MFAQILNGKNLGLTGVRCDLEGGACAKYHPGTPATSTYDYMITGSGGAEAESVEQ